MFEIMDFENVNLESETYDVLR